MQKFTFKNHIHSGKWKSFEPEGCFVKLGRAKVGNIQEIRSYSITDPNAGKFSISFQVIKKDIMEDKNPNCLWKWITLKYKPSSLKEAKDFVVKFSEDIQKKFHLYIEEDGLY